MSEKEAVVEPKENDPSPKTTENPNLQDDVVKKIGEIGGVDLGFIKPSEGEWPDTFEHLWQYKDGQDHALLIRHDGGKDEYQLKICLPDDEKGCVISTAYGGPKDKIAQMAEVTNILASRVLKPENVNLDLGYTFYINNPKYALTLFLNSYAKKHGLTRYII